LPIDKFTSQKRQKKDSTYWNSISRNWKSWNPNWIYEEFITDYGRISVIKTNPEKIEIHEKCAIRFHLPENRALSKDRLLYRNFV